MPEPQRLHYTDLAPQGIAALRSLEHYANTATGLEPILLELVRLRASLLNGCDYCVSMHTHELQKHNETPDRIAQVASWRTSAAYTHREQAALAWTEVITNIQQGHAPQEAFEAARLHFSDKELVDLTLAIASINAWNRLAIAFRAQHTPESNTQDPIADDGGKVAVDE
jgi:AhpD family alkylhydroperoxidase